MVEVKGHRGQLENAEENDSEIQIIRKPFENKFDILNHQFEIETIKKGAHRPFQYI